VVLTVTRGGARHLHVFATGSTAGPLRRAAQAFSLKEDTTFEVTVGGTVKLITRMCEWREGDLFCGGSESSIDTAIMFGAALSDSIRPLGVRETVVLVPNGNPAEIGALRDLTRKDVRVGVANQGSLANIWEEVALKAGHYHSIRARITNVAGGSSDLLAVLARREIDAAIGWASFALLAPERVEMVPIASEWCAWRCTSVAATPWSDDKELAKSFIDFLISEEGQEFYRKFGWKSLAAARSPE
jgi:accessory colonization factor AcfC